MDYDKQLQKIDKLLHKVGASKTPADTQVRIFSEKLGIDYRYESESRRPFHGASVGKVFVIALLIKMAHEKKINLDQRIHEILDPKYLTGLFVVEGLSLIHICIYICYIENK